MPNYEASSLRKLFFAGITSLSELYWHYKLYSCAFNTTMTTSQDITLGKLCGETWVGNRVTMSTKKILEGLDDELRTLRLHLLMVSCAHLETYLTEIIPLHLAAVGFFDRERLLDLAVPKQNGAYVSHARIQSVTNGWPESIPLILVGQQLAKPVTNASSLPEMMKYTRQLLEVDDGDTTAFTKASTLLDEAYDIRNVVAHLGGRPTIKRASKLKALNLDPDEPIPFADEQKLFRYWDAATTLVDMIDRAAVDTKRFRVSASSLNHHSLGVKVVDSAWTLAKWAAWDAFQGLTAKDEMKARLPSRESDVRPALMRQGIGSLKTMENAAVIEFYRDIIRRQKERDEEKDAKSRDAAHVTRSRVGRHRTS
jgi:hypothetical protein